MIPAQSVHLYKSYCLPTALYKRLCYQLLVSLLGFLTLGTVGIFGLLCGLPPERGLLATRGGFLECLADFDIVRMGTSPYLTSTLASITLWS